VPVASGGPRHDGVKGNRSSGAPKDCQADHENSRGRLVWHLDDFVAAYTFALRLKITPYEFVYNR
jgi:hypothetical protein